MTDIAYTYRPIVQWTTLLSLLPVLITEPKLHLYHHFASCSFFFFLLLSDNDGSSTRESAID